MNILNNIEELNNLELRENSFTIIDIPSMEQLEKDKYIIQITSKSIVENNSKISILYSNIKPKEVYSSIINKKIKISNISKLPSNERQLQLKNIKNIIKSKLCFSYTTETTTNELIEKCQYLKNIKKVDIITISNIERIKDLNEENKQEFFKKLEKISIQLKVTIMLMI